MKFHMMMASAAALAFATGAVAQDAMAPATDAPAPSAAPAAPAAPDAAAPASPDASMGAAAMTTPAGSATAADTATTSDGTATAAAPPAADAATAAAPQATDTQTAAAAPAAPAVDPAKTQAADQMIAQNWSKYDAGGKGQLTPLEFGSWVLAAQGNDMTAQIEKSRQSRSANLPSTKVLNATSAEFSKADANKDRMISQDELRTYLAG